MVFEKEYLLNSRCVCLMYSVSSRLLSSQSVFVHAWSYLYFRRARTSALCVQHYTSYTTFAIRGFSLEHVQSIGCLFCKTSQQQPAYLYRSEDYDLTILGGSDDRRITRRWSGPTVSVRRRPAHRSYNTITSLCAMSLTLFLLSIILFAISL